MMERLAKLVGEILGRDVKGEKIVDSIDDLCDMIKDLKRENVQLQMKNTAILKRVARAKVELEVIA